MVQAQFLDRSLGPDSCGEGACSLGMLKTHVLGELLQEVLPGSQQARIEAAPTACIEMFKDLALGASCWSGDPEVRGE